MKRYIRCNDIQDNKDISYGIGVFDDSGDFIGYLFKYSESRGCRIAKCSTNSDMAKSYRNLTSAKRAIGYYHDFSEIYVYDDNHNLPVAKYVHVRDGFDLSKLYTNYCTYYSAEGCTLSVVEIGQY